MAVEMPLLTTAPLCVRRSLAVLLVVATGAACSSGAPWAARPSAPGGAAAVSAGEPSPASAGDPVNGAEREILEAHNGLRDRHCAEPLLWSKRLAATARAWAEELRDRGCAFDHSPSTDLGENLYYTFPSGPQSGAKAVETWYEESRRYSYRRARFGMKTGHFTQLVWRGTRELGCGTAQCNGGDIVVCNYSPAGNVVDHFRDNVLPTTCR